jgi:hypothetical protein
MCWGLYEVICHDLFKLLQYLDDVVEETEINYCY